MMRQDTLLQLLQHAGAAAVPSLLVLDEDVGQVPARPWPAAHALSKRHDLYTAARRLGWPCEFNDLAFDSLPDLSFRRALYRVSKEKRVVEHVLQSLWHLLPPEGELLLAGYKNEGIKTFARRAQQAWDCDVGLTRGEGQLHLYHFRKRGLAASALNDEDYHALRVIGDWQGRPVYSKPGIFAWDRFDAGSLFLLDYLPQFLQQTDCRRQTALDLGCGYGLLALALLAAGCAQVHATDNNAAALRACAHNLQQHAAAEQQTSVVAADCGDALTGRYDLLVCNPPFHQGFEIEQDLTGRFLQASRRLLTPGGRALFVVNSFIPLERKATGLYGTATRVADNGRFKLVVLEQRP